jgi:hypothetical protein
MKIILVLSVPSHHAIDDIGLVHHHLIYRYFTKNILATLDYIRFSKQYSVVINNRSHLQSNLYITCYRMRLFVEEIVFTFMHETTCQPVLILSLIECHVIINIRSTPTNVQFPPLLYPYNDWWFNPLMLPLYLNVSTIQTHWFGPHCCKRPFLGVSREILIRRRLCCIATLLNNGCNMYCYTQTRTCRLLILIKYPK